MRQCDRYNPPWERYTRANYMQVEEIVKRKTIKLATSVRIDRLVTQNS